MAGFQRDSVLQTMESSSRVALDPQGRVARREKSKERAWNSPKYVTNVTRHELLSDHQNLRFWKIDQKLVQNGTFGPWNSRFALDNSIFGVQTRCTDTDGRTRTHAHGFWCLSHTIGPSGNQVRRPKPWWILVHSWFEYRPVMRYRNINP